MFGFVRVVTPEITIKPRTLSEAIEMGARLRPQAFDTFIDGNKSCALMSAYEATTGKRNDSLLGALFVPLYLKFKYHVPLLTISYIFELNDIKRRSREVIAYEIRKQGY